MRARSTEDLVIPIQAPPVQHFYHLQTSTLMGASMYAGLLQPWPDSGRNVDLSIISGARSNGLGPCPLQGASMGPCII